LLFFGVIMFSASAGKRHSYLLPLLPLLAIQIALEFSNFFEQGGAGFRKRLLKSAGIIERFLLCILAVLIFGVTFVAESGILRSVNFRAAYFSLLPLLARLGPIVLILGLVALVGVRRNLKFLMASVWITSIVTLTSIVAAGAVIKSNFKAFDAIAMTWLATVGESEELGVFKHPFDEYFDPLLFYVRRPVRLIALDRIGEECREDTVYAAKRGWLDAHQHLFSGEIVRIVIAQERLLASRGDNKRDLVFFRCGLRGSWDL
jgi:hypothetical protein